MKRNLLFCLLFFVIASFVFSQTNVDIKINNGIIMELVADDHAGYAAIGYDIVCAVISSTLRTYLYIVTEIQNLGVNYDVSRRGHMSIKIVTINGDNTLIEQLRGMSRFIIRTFNDLEKEYPDNININITSN
jgi:uncharacterized protein YsxB (DUF464 family)